MLKHDILDQIRNGHIHALKEHPDTFLREGFYEVIRKSNAKTGNIENDRDCNKIRCKKY